MDWPCIISLIVAAVVGGIYGGVAVIVVAVWYRKDEEL